MHGRKLARHHAARRVMMPRAFLVLFAPRDSSAPFRPFSFLFSLWTPLRLFCFFTHILLSRTPIDAPFSPTRSTSKHLSISTINGIYFSTRPISTIFWVLFLISINFGSYSFARPVWMTLRIFPIFPDKNGKICPSM